MTASRPVVLWFRRDLRLADHPALLAAAGDGPVVPLFVVDPALAQASPNRRAHLARSLAELDRRLDGRLVVRTGRPEQVVPGVVAEAGAAAVHVTADTAPFGIARDRRVEAALGPVPLVRTGSPYAVGPGLLRTGAGTPYRVLTPFLKAWTDHGWPAPAAPADVEWRPLPGEPVPSWRTGIELPAAGEHAALDRWRDFLADGIDDYATDRDRPDLPGTSRLSVALRFGEVHPRTLLAGLARLEAEGRDGDGPRSFRSELAWREFHADRLWHHPEALRQPLRPEFAEMEYDDPGPGFDAWCAGRTGFPIVDAGMRQLVATGWMHNRVRMVTASFLVKDLHVHWTHGARFFLHHLLDGDVAQNQLSWQWVAGCGADAAPWFRIFNPARQADRFDPEDAYVRRWVPEVGSPDYPEPVVDHAEERREALARLDRVHASAGKGRMGA